MIDSLEYYYGHKKNKEMDDYDEYDDHEIEERQSIDEDYESNEEECE